MGSKLGSQPCLFCESHAEYAGQLPSLTMASATTSAGLHFTGCRSCVVTREIYGDFLVLSRSRVDGSKL